VPVLRCSVGRGICVDDGSHAGHRTRWNNNGPGVSARAGPADRAARREGAAHGRAATKPAWFPFARNAFPSARNAFHFSRNMFRPMRNVFPATWNWFPVTGNVFPAIGSPFPAAWNMFGSAWNRASTVCSSPSLHAW